MIRPVLKRSCTRSSCVCCGHTNSSKPCSLKWKTSLNASLQDYTAAHVASHHINLDVSLLLWAQHLAPPATACSQALALQPQRAHKPRPSSHSVLTSTATDHLISHRLPAPAKSSDARPAKVPLLHFANWILAAIGVTDGSAWCTINATVTYAMFAWLQARNPLDTRT